MFKRRQQILFYIFLKQTVDLDIRRKKKKLYSKVENPEMLADFLSIFAKK